MLRSSCAIFMVRGYYETCMFGVKHISFTPQVVWSQLYLLRSS